MRLPAACAALVLLAACDGAYLANGTMEPLETPGTWRWRTFADPATGPEDPEAEAGRLRALGKLMSETPGCANSYRITDRQVALNRVTVVGGRVYDVYYSLDCRPS